MTQPQLRVTAKGKGEPKLENQSCEWVEHKKSLTKEAQVVRTEVFMIGARKSSEPIK